mgnify:CR=1 FL=1
MTRSTLCILYNDNVLTSGAFLSILYLNGVVYVATTNLNIRTDKAIKDRAEKIFNELGLNMTTAVNMFLKVSIRTHGIPFELKMDVPQETTADESEEG